MSKKKLTYNDFKKYFGNNLQDKDKHAFEKKMMQDAFEEEAFDGLSELSEEELEEDITKLKAGINKRTKQSHRIVPGWFKYAASVIILLGIGLTLIIINNHFWQDSMLKEQVAKEMEIADSLVKQAEKAKPEIYDKREKDSTDELSKELIAETKKTELEESPKVIVQKDVIAEDEMEISEQDYEIDSDETDENLALEAEEQFPEEDLSHPNESAANEPITVMENREAEEELAFVSAKKEVSTESISENRLEDKASRSTSRSKKLDRSVSGKEKAAAPSAFEDEKSTSTIIKGKILSANDDLSIPGVSVIVKDNPAIGTTTNMDGEFELNIPNDDELKTLIASFVGMETQEITIENDSNLMVYMEPDVMEMDEVVVTGYGVGQDKDIESVKIDAQPPNDLSIRKFKEQILENLDYANLSEYQGKYKIRFSFTVATDGSLHNFNFKNVPGIEFSNEIKRVIKKLGNWKPATENDSSISSEVKMSLKIEISNEM